ncbi:MAG: septal ring lytic transglycosylase RlpA family protein [Akkermansiaceae bacterium]|nr:septal ring lytic transglycosylase RlpA family protein [Akkermansiaceae bacterium]
MKKLPSIFLAAALVSGATFANDSKPTEADTPEANQPVETQTPDGLTVARTLHGEASWYEIKCNGGTHTASGIPLRDHAMTAAHKTLPMGTLVRVTNLRNAKSVILKITDRGPYIKGRIIDVTKGAAKKLEFVHKGIVKCKVEVLEKPDTSTASNDE